MKCIWIQYHNNYLDPSYMDIINTFFLYTSGKSTNSWVGFYYFILFIISLFIILYIYYFIPSWQYWCTACTLWPGLNTEVSVRGSLCNSSGSEPAGSCTQAPCYVACKRGQRSVSVKPGGFFTNAKEFCTQWQWTPYKKHKHKIQYKVNRMTHSHPPASIPLVLWML